MIDCFFVVGERSGDQYAAALLTMLRERFPDLRCAGMGGEALRDAGCEIVQDIDGLDVMGLLPVLARLPFFLRLGSRIEAEVRQRQPHLVVSIDYPGFNIRLQRRLRGMVGTRRLHVVAPQVWAWRPRRAKAIAAAVDELHCFFPFEPPLFHRFDCDARFIGHPLVDLVHQDEGGGTSAQMVEPVLLVAPGSRRRELDRLLPVFLPAARLIASRTGARIRIAVAPHRRDEEYERHGVPGAWLDRRPFRTQCRSAHAGLIASGTATLEAALCGLPHVLAYRADVVTARIMRHLLYSPWVGLPNIIHGHEVVRELLQEDCSVAQVVRAVEDIWAGGGRRRQVGFLQKTEERLGGGGAMTRCAGRLGDLVEGHRQEAAEKPR